MRTETFKVVGMSCGHCVGAVTAEVSSLPGVTGVEVDLATGSVTVTSEHPLDPATFAVAIEEAGFEVAAT